MNDSHIYIYSYILQQAKHAKYLGIIIDKTCMVMQNMHVKKVVITKHTLDL